MIDYIKKQKRRIIAVIIPAVIILMVIFALCTIYVSNYYHADLDAISKFEITEEISTEKLDNDKKVYFREGAKKGFIFYPGGKVEYTSYEPLMKACAEKGILCVLLDMPFNLAVLDMNGADGVREQYPEIEEWYIGGHSLGGSMAASYVAKHTKDYEGLILLGAYSTADLSESGLNILSIYGSEDKVLNYNNYIKNKSNLPDNYTEIIIDGGCHAYFGMYGHQKGDGTPTITNEEQIKITADAIAESINAPCENRTHN